MSRAMEHDPAHLRANDASTRTERKRRKPVITNVRRAGTEHQVVTVEGGGLIYRRTPCSDCPWRKDAVGVFPAEAFRHSAPTAYDMSQKQFACHQSPSTKPAICAGFLLRGADHNLAVRLLRIQGKIEDDVDEAGHELHANYSDMAIANGVDPTEQCLEKCR